MIAIFFAFFFKKNLEKGKCLTYLCIVNLERHKPYTEGIAKLYEWQGKLGGKSAENRRALDQMARRGNPNDIRGKGHRNKIKRALEILTINY